MSVIFKSDEEARLWVVIARDALSIEGRNAIVTADQAVLTYRARVPETAECDYCGKVGLDPDKTVLGCCDMECQGAKVARDTLANAERDEMRARADAAKNAMDAVLCQQGPRPPSPTKTQVEFRAQETMQFGRYNIRVHAGQVYTLPEDLYRKIKGAFSHEVLQIHSTG